MTEAYITRFAGDERFRGVSTGSFKISEKGVNPPVETGLPYEDIPRDAPVRTTEFGLEFEHGPGLHDALIVKQHGRIRHVFPGQHVILKAGYQFFEISHRASEVTEL